MAKRMVAFCDRTHGDGDRLSTTSKVFAVDGVELEIDLCDEHVVEFTRFLQQQEAWRAAGRTTAAPKRPRRSSPPAASAGSSATQPEAAAGERDKRGGTPENAAIREWAAAAGYPATSRGRISKEVREAYRAYLRANATERWDAHASDQPAPDSEALDPRAVAAVAAEAEAEQAPPPPTPRPVPAPAPVPAPVSISPAVAGPAPSTDPVRLAPAPAVLVGRLANANPTWPVRPPQRERPKESHG